MFIFLFLHFLKFFKQFDIEVNYISEFSLKDNSFNHLGKDESEITLSPQLTRTEEIKVERTIVYSQDLEEVKQLAQLLARNTSLWLDFLKESK